MRFVSPLLKKVVYPAMHRSGSLKRFVPSDACFVVNYHGVIPPSPYCRHPFLDANLVSAAALRKQLRFLKNNYHVIDSESFRAWLEKRHVLPPRSVLVTCDDGLANNLSEMLPVLQGEGVPCLFFITGESCGERPGMLWYEELYHLLTGGVNDTDVETIFEIDRKHFPQNNFQGKWWTCVMSASHLNLSAREEKMALLRSLSKFLPSTLPERWRRMNGEELKILAGSGMSIGAHTMSHPVLARCSEEEARREVDQSRAALERLLGDKVWAFAYPFGNPATMGKREVNFARDAGFECAFVNVGGGAVDPSQRFELARTHVTADMSLAEFDAHLSGFHNRLQAAVRG
jgi:peptidoglycan/xylan/chitin deacetylase (PgdA/CDA1 family)